MLDPNEIRETVFHVTRDIDEVPAHGPTLEDAAHYLAGIPEDEDTEAAGEPRARHGDLIELTCWQYIGDRIAVRSSTGWSLEPPIPEQVRFLAHRTWGDGWSEEDVIGAPTNLDNHFSHLDADEEREGPIACAYETEVLMVFHLLESVPVLIPAPDKDTIAWLQLKLLRAERSADKARYMQWDAEEKVTRLCTAGKIVIDGLNARIDEAPGEAKPVFAGIAELHAALQLQKDAT